MPHPVDLLEYSARITKEQDHCRRPWKCISKKRLHVGGSATKRLGVDACGRQKLRLQQQQLKMMTQFIATAATDCEMHWRITDNNCCWCDVRKRRVTSATLEFTQPFSSLTGALFFVTHRGRNTRRLFTNTYFCRLLTSATAKFRKFGN